jgi:hypothetical protein
MRRIVLASASFLLLPIFLHNLINGTIFVRKVLNIKSLFLFYLLILSETFLILRRTERDVITDVHRLYEKNPLFLMDFNYT